MASAEIETETKTLDEFSYLKTGGFSSENFKVEVRNLPKFYGISEFRKLLTSKLSLSPIKVKPPHQLSKWIYVSFSDELQRGKAIDALNGFKWKGSVLECRKSDPAPDPLVKKRKNENEESENAKKLDLRSQEERLKDNAIPYWNLPYSEQIKMKEKCSKEIIIKLGKQLWNKNRNLGSYISSQRSKNNGLICDLKPIKVLDKIEGYRNKCEFTIGTDAETKLPTVGFRLGTYVSGSTGVAPVQGLCHISPQMKEAVTFLQDFIRSSDLGVYSPEDHSGYWKQLTVRQSAHNNELMLIIGMHVQTLSEEEQNNIRDSLVDYIKKCKHDIIIKSVYFMKITRREKADVPSEVEHIFGDTHIYEYIHGLKFRISPQAFFQINTPAAEVLYQTAIDMSNPDKSSTVLDICCGTGTVGLCFSKYCDQVLGLELVPEAVADAKENALVNECDNAEFFTGRVEDALYSVCEKSRNENNIAVIDPPRSGIHMRALVQLRKTKNIKKIVYMSCDPSAAMKNFVDLGRAHSKTMHGSPFVPTGAVAVDMFPHTKHFEMVIVFERMDSDRLKGEPKDNRSPDDKSKEETNDNRSPDGEIKEEIKDNHSPSGEVKEETKDNHSPDAELKE